MKKYLAYFHEEAFPEFLESDNYVTAVQFADLEASRRGITVFMVIPEKRYRA